MSINHASTRREFLRNGTLGGAAGLLAAGAVHAGEDQPQATPQSPPDQPRDPDHSAHGEHEFPRMHPGPSGPVGSNSDRGKLVVGYRVAGDPPVAVVTPDIPDLEWELKDGVREFHLIAQHVRREFLPGMHFDVWGYNGVMPGPRIQAVEGDRVRIIVHNELPEPTTVHWHGFELPVRFDGVPGLTQEPIPPGGEFVYEFDLHQNGTFFYHSHGAMQEVMGMAGLFIIHPREAYLPPVDFDFGLVLQEFAVLPQTTIPNSLSEEFNFFTINGRSGPFVTPMVVKLGSRVRIRFMNLSAMDHHPMHLHGHTFWITGTEGGRIPESAWIPSNNVLVGVGQSRDVEFIANNPGDWMIHCHILHHMMNHMVSMVRMPEMMGGHGGGLPAGNDFAAGTGMNPEGPALSDENGASLGRGMGPQTANERPTMTGHRPGTHEMHPKFRVPGFPQDMMDMKLMQMSRMVPHISGPLTRGMRRNWFTGVEAMMTVLRVLPPDLYDQVVSGRGEIPPGVSVPGGGPGEGAMHGPHRRNGQAGHGEHRPGNGHAPHGGHERHDRPDQHRH